MIFSKNGNRTPFEPSCYKGNSNGDEIGFSDNLQLQALVLSKGLQNHATRTTFSGTLPPTANTKRKIMTERRTLLFKGRKTMYFHNHEKTYLPEKGSTTRCSHCSEGGLIWCFKAVSLSRCIFLAGRVCHVTIFSPSFSHSKELESPSKTLHSHHDISPLDLSFRFGINQQRRWCSYGGYGLAFINSPWILQQSTQSYLYLAFSKASERLQTNKFNLWMLLAISSGLWDCSKSSYSSVYIPHFLVEQENRTRYLRHFSGKLCLGGRDFIVLPLKRLVCYRTGRTCIPKKSNSLHKEMLKKINFVKVKHYCFFLASNCYEVQSSFQVLRIF